MVTDKIKQLRNAFGTFLTGVTVVTTQDKAGNPIGFTANSFASVSLDPPLLSVGIDKKSSNFEHFTQAKHFAINILAEHQLEVSNVFARKVEDRFSHVKWQQSKTGSPILQDVCAWFDCSMFQVIEAGDHAVLIGLVEDFATSDSHGLGYYKGTYHTPSLSLATNPEVCVTALIKHDNHLLLLENKDSSFSLPFKKVGKEGLSIALEQIFQEVGTAITADFIYSIYEDKQHNRQHIVFLCTTNSKELPKSSQLNSGQFFDAQALAEVRIDDFATRSMLDRFAEETQQGHYGIYYGDQDSSATRKLTN